MINFISRETAEHITTVVVMCITVVTYFQTTWSIQLLPITPECVNNNRTSFPPVVVHTSAVV